MSRPIEVTNPFVGYRWKTTIPITQLQLAPSWLQITLTIVQTDHFNLRLTTILPIINLNRLPLHPPLLPSTIRLSMSLLHPFRGSIVKFPRTQHPVEPIFNPLKTRSPIFHPHLLLVRSAKASRLMTIISLQLPTIQNQTLLSDSTSSSALQIIHTDSTRPRRPTQLLIPDHTQPNEQLTNALHLTLLIDLSRLLPSTRVLPSSASIKMMNQLQARVI